MRSVKITRKKSFFGALIPYFIFVGYPKTEINPLDPDDIWDFPDTSDVRISNGQTIAVSIPDGKCSILVWADTSTGVASSSAYLIDEGTTDIELELVTKYSWIHGSQYVLRPDTARHCRVCWSATSSKPGCPGGQWRAFGWSVGQHHWVVSPVRYNAIIKSVGLVSTDFL